MNKAQSENLKHTYMIHKLFKEKNAMQHTLDFQHPHAPLDLKFYIRGESQKVQGACSIFFIHAGSAQERKTS